MICDGIFPANTSWTPLVNLRWQQPRVTPCPLIENRIFDGKDDKGSSVNFMRTPVTSASASAVLETCPSDSCSLLGHSQRSQCAPLRALRRVLAPSESGYKQERRLTAGVSPPRLRGNRVLVLYITFLPMWRNIPLFVNERRATKSPTSGYSSYKPIKETRPHGLLKDL